MKYIGCPKCGARMPRIGRRMLFYCALHGVFRLARAFARRGRKGGGVDGVVR